MEIPNARLLKKVTVGVLMAVGSLATQLHADASQSSTNPQAEPSQPQADPFIKKDATPVDETGPVANLIVTGEAYRLSQAEGTKLIQENDTDEARHDQVLELVKAGKARLDAVLAGAVQSGQQLVVEQVDTLPYAITFRVLPDKSVLADEIKKRELGYRLVVKGETTVDNKFFDESLFFEHSTLRDFADLHLTYDTGPFTAAFPEFDTQRVNTKPPAFPFEKFRFLGTYSPTPLLSFPAKISQPNSKVEDSEMTLVFEKVSQVQLAPGTLTDSKPAAVEMQLSLFSMDREEARQILSQKQEMDSAYQAVQSLVKANQAKLEHLSIIRTQVGLKVACDEVTEITYPSGGFHAETETQDVGFKWEVAPSFNAYRNAPFLSVDLSQSQLVSDLGNLPAGEVAATNNSQPAFESRNLETVINSALGEHELLGTLSPAGDTGVNGQKDTGRVWLEFIQTTAVNP